MLSELVDSHLATQHGPGRFAMHDLLRVYAAEQAAEREPQTERRAAIQRVLDYRGHWHQWAATQRIALAAARLGDMAGQAAARRAIATACIRLTDYRQARGHLAACLRLHRQLDDRAGEALARHSLGRVAAHQGRYADALRHEQLALGLFRDAAEQAGQAIALNAIGWYHTLLGRLQQARAFCQQALILYRHVGSRVGQAQAWDSLGYAEHQLGRLDHATACYQQALGIFRDLGELFGQADTLVRLGDTRAAAPDLPAARDAQGSAAIPGPSLAGPAGRDRRSGRRAHAAGHRSRARAGCPARLWLPYRHLKLRKQWAQQGSNLRPLACKMGYFGRWTLVGVARQVLDQP